MLYPFLIAVIAFSHSSHSLFSQQPSPFLTEVISFSHRSHRLFSQQPSPFLKAAIAFSHSIHLLFSQKPLPFPAAAIAFFHSSHHLFSHQPSPFLTSAIAFSHGYCLCPWTRDYSLFIQSWTINHMAIAFVGNIFLFIIYAIKRLSRRKYFPEILKNLLDQKTYENTYIQ